MGNQCNPILYIPFVNCVVLMLMARVTTDFTRLTGNKSLGVEIFASDNTDICKTLDKSLVGVIGQI